MYRAALVIHNGAHRKMPAENLVQCATATTRLWACSPTSLLQASESQLGPEGAHIRNPSTTLPLRATGSDEGASIKGPARSSPAKLRASRTQAAPKKVLATRASRSPQSYEHQGPPPNTQTASLKGPAQSAPAKLPVPPRHQMPPPHPA